jgi:hypothetical protein
VFLAHIVEVAVCTSPDDTGRFRTAVGRALTGWNSAGRDRHNILLMPCRGERGVVDQHRGCDVLIGVFDPIQQNTDDVLGGLVRARHARKVALAWVIAESPHDRSNAVDDVELRVLSERLMTEGIRPQYVGHQDLHLESRMQGALTDGLSISSIDTLMGGFDRTEAARQVTTYRTPVPLLGPEIWAVTVVNHGSGLAIDLRVLVDAVDPDGNHLPDGARRSQQKIAEVFANLRTGTWPEQHREGTEPGAPSLAQRSVLPSSRMDLLAAHTALDFPRWLRPEQHASALYELPVGASPDVHIKFENEAGEMWCRSNDAEPELVSPSPRRDHTERLRVAPVSQ